MDLDRQYAIIPPMAEIIRRVWDNVGRHIEPSLYGDRRPQARPLEPRVELLLERAQTTTGDESRQSYKDAAMESAAIFRTADTPILTAEDRAQRGRYAELAVTGYLSAGEIEDAQTFGAEAMEDPQLPAVSRARIEKALEISA